MLSQEINKFSSVLLEGLMHEMSNPICCVNSNLSALRSQASKLSEHPQAETEEDIITEINEIVEESQEGLARVTALINALKYLINDSAKSVLIPLDKPIRTALLIAKSVAKHKANIQCDLEVTAAVDVGAQKLSLLLVKVIIEIANLYKEYGDIEIKTVQNEKTVDLMVCVEPTKWEDAFDINIVDAEINSLGNGVENLKCDDKSGVVLHLVFPQPILTEDE